MPFDLMIHKNAEKQLLKILKTDPVYFKKINLSFVELKDNLFSSSLWIKKLHGKYQKFFCIKIGNYRIKFGVKDDIITIFEID